MRQPPTSPYGARGPFSGLMELASPKHIDPNSFAAASNVQMKGGRPCARPGLERVRTGAFIGSTSIVSQNECKNIVLDTSTSPDRIGYIKGATVRSVNVDGTSDAQVHNPNSSSVRGLALLSTTMYYGYLDSASTGDWIIASLTFAGSSTNRLQLDADVFTLIDLTVDATYIWYTGYHNTLGWQLRRCTLAGASDTVLLSSTLTPLGGMAYDVTNGHIFVSGYDSVSANGLAAIYRYNTSGVLQDTFTSQYAVEDIAVDTTNNRLYWTNNVSGRRAIAYTTYTPATGALADGETTLISFTSTARPFGIAVDGPNDIVYFGDNAASGGSVSKVTSDSTIVSSFFWRRSLVASTVSTFTDDLTILQFLSPSAGGSTFKCYFPSRTAPNDLFDLNPGYTAASGSNPDIFVMQNRTTDVSSSTSIFDVGSYARASFAYTSSGFDTNRGGVLMCGDGPFVVNYYAGDTAAVNEVQNVTILGAPTGGTFNLTLGTTATGNIAYNASAATFDSTLTTAIATDTASATCDVTRTGSGSNSDPYIYQVTFTGTLAGIGLPLLRPTTNGLTGGAAPQVIVERVTQGSSFPNGRLWLRPAGLPRPSAPTMGGASGGGNLTGLYEYVITFYSSLLGIESPPSDAAISAAHSSTYNSVSWSVPTTLYFDDYFDSPSIPGGPVIDRVRIYRKKTGTSAHNDGIGADPQYFFVADVAANRATYIDNISDGARTAETIPSIKEYPPADAQYVAVVDGVAYYVGGGANNKVVWNSEKTLLGGVWDGEIGYEYVANNSYTEAFDDTPTDHSIVGLAKLGGQLVVGTDERILAADTSQVDTLGLAFRAIEGSAGFASHWCVAETNPLAGDEIQGGLLLFANPKGGMYAFDGVKSFPVGRKEIFETIKSFSRKTWQDTTLGFGSITSWYWATVVTDPYNNRIIMAAPLTAGGSTCMVYDLDTRSWFPWSINKLAWVLGREWDTSADLGAPVVLCFDGSSVFKLVDGENDDGMDFTWSLTTGKLDLGMPITTKRIKGLVADFDTDDFGGSLPAVTVAAYFDGSATANASNAFTLGSGSIESEKYAPRVGLTGLARHVQIKVSGTQASNTTHALLCAYGIEFEQAGSRLE